MAPFCSQNIVLLCPARGTAVPRYGRRRRKGANAAKCRAPGMCKAKTPPQQTGYPSQSAPAISGMPKPHPCRNSRSTGTDTIPASGRAPQLLAGKARSPGFAPRRPGYARPKHCIKSQSATEPKPPSHQSGHRNRKRPAKTKAPKRRERPRGSRNAAGRNRRPEPQAGIYRRRVGSMAVRRPWSEPPTVQPANRPQQVTAALSAPKYIQPPRRRTARRNRRPTVPGHNRVRARPCHAA